MCRNLKLNKLKFTFCPTDEHGRVILREIQISIYMFLRSTDRSRLRATLFFSKSDIWFHSTPLHPAAYYDARAQWLSSVCVYVLISALLAGAAPS